MPGPRLPTTTERLPPVRAIIFINGVIAEYGPLRDVVRADDLLIAADGGARHALALGHTPHILVGDLDSVEAETVELLRARGTTIERHPAAKDQTDLELAIERAVREGAEEVILLGATGGRLDQTLANLLILAQRDWGIPVQLLEGDQSAMLLRGPATLAVEGVPGSTLSVIPLSPQVTGIRYTGLEYPLENATLELGSTRGISNVLRSASATVQIDSGLLLVVVGRNETRPTA